MYIESLDISGLLDLPSCSLNKIPAEGMCFRKSTPATTALSDALALWFAAFDPDDLVNWVVRMGWAHEEDIQIVGEEIVEEVGWMDGQLPQLWVEDRDVSIQCSISLDSNEVSYLRSRLSDPEIQIALMERPVITGTVVIRFSNDFQVMSIERNAFLLGHYSLPIDRNFWKPIIYSFFNQRFVRNHPYLFVSEVALETLLSLSDYELYESFQHACTFGKIRVATNADGEPILLLDSKPIQRWGTEIERQIRLLAVCHLIKADIVWSEDLPKLNISRQIWGIDKHSSIDDGVLNVVVVDAPINFRKPVD